MDFGVAQHCLVCFTQGDIINRIWRKTRTDTPYLLTWNFAGNSHFVCGRIPALFIVPCGMKADTPLLWAALGAQICLFEKFIQTAVGGVGETINISLSWDVWITLVSPCDYMLSSNYNITKNPFGLGLFLRLTSEVMQNWNASDFHFLPCFCFLRVSRCTSLPPPRHMHVFGCCTEELL